MNATSDVTPLANLHNLQLLNLAVNDIADVTPLAGLTGVRALELGRGNILTAEEELPHNTNQITDLTPLSGLTNLLYLGLAGNGITNVYPLFTLSNLCILWLDDNPIADFLPLSALHNLLFLTLMNTGMNDCGIKALRPLTSLVALAIIGNPDATDIYPLKALQNLQVLYAQGCGFTDLQPLVDNTGIGAGDEVYLNGNPLRAVASCLQIPELEAWNVTVEFAAGCPLSNPPDSGSTTDTDGDSMRDYAEWEYLSLFCADPTYLWETYVHWADDPALQPPANYGCLETSPVTIRVRGQGTIYPGVGTHPFARYARTCEEPCPSSGYPNCPFNQVTFVAQPAPGWVFKRWGGDAAGNPGTTATLTVNDLNLVTAEFIERPGIDTLDLAGDFAYFLSAIHATQSPDVFDLNAVSYDDDAHRIYEGNGMPDIVELRLLESVLKQPALDLSGRSGVVHDVVWSAWEHNVQQAEVDLPTVSSQLTRVVAAYATLGDFGSLAMIQWMVKTHYPDPAHSPFPQGSDIAVGSYDLSCQEWLCYDGDADNDGELNGEEWQAVLASNPADPEAAYLSSALDPGTPGESAGGAGGAAQPPPCDNAACTTPARLYVWPVSPPTWAQPPTPPSIKAWANGQEIAVGQETFLPVGTQVRVKVAPGKGCQMEGWGAAGTLANESRRLKEEFTLTGYTDVHATLFSSMLLIYGPPDGYGASITVTPSADAYLTNDISGYLYAVGTTSSTVDLEVTFANGRDTCFCWEAGDGNVQPARNYFTNRVTARTYKYPGSYGGYVAPFYPIPISDYERQHLKRYWCASGAGGETSCGTQTSWPHNGNFVGAVNAYDTGHLVIAAHPSRGYGFDHWEKVCPGGTFDDYDYDTFASPDCEVIASFTRNDAYSLTLATKAIRGGYARCAGYATADPAMKYYGKDAVVELTAHENPGYVFVRWDGIGTVTQGNPGTERALDDEDNPVTATTIRVAISDNRSVSAVYAKQDVEAELLSIAFTSDHGVLRKNSPAATFAEDNVDTVPYSSPEWTKEGVNNPISQTRNTAIQAAVSLRVEPAGRPFRLEGTIGGLSGGGLLTGTGTSTGNDQDVQVASDAALPNTIDVLHLTIDWKLMFTDCLGGEIDLGTSGEHEMFVTWGVPNEGLALPPGATNPGTAKPTYVRMAWICGSASGVTTALDLASRVANAAHDKTEFGAWAESYSVWEACDDKTKKLDCVGGRELALLMLAILGFPSDRAGRFMAYPSTDNYASPPPPSDCTSAEQNEYGQLFYAVSPSEPLERWYAGENGLSVRTASGMWLYITVHDRYGPLYHTGDESLNSLRCLYEIMDLQRQDCPGYCQAWGKDYVNHPAPNLP